MYEFYIRFLIVNHNKYNYFCKIMNYLINFITFLNITPDLTRVNHSFDWFNWFIVLLCIITIIVTRLSDYDHIPNLFKIKPKASSLKKLSSISLIINYFLITSLIVWEIIQYKDPIINNYYFYIIILIAVIGLTILKFGIIKVINYIFKQQNFHIENHLLFFQNTGLILLPLYIISYYASNDNKLIFYLIILSYFAFILVLRELKSLFTALKLKISFFYIILYLCTLEILPILIGLKFILN